MPPPDSKPLETLSLAELRDLVGTLVAKVADLGEANATLKAENQALREEVARLKGLPPRPPSRPSGMEQRLPAAAGCGVVRAENASGRRRDVQTELQVLLDFVQPGDTLVNTRIAKFIKDLRDVVQELKEKGIALRATTQPVDTGTTAGKAFLDMLGVFAELETNLRRERQLEGVKAAKEKGISKHLSRPAPLVLVPG